MPGLLDSSAIEQMMRALSPQPQVTPNNAGGLLGGPTPAVMSSGMPQMPAPPMAQPRQSMVDRIHDRMSGLLDSVKSDAPPGYNGLLSPEEMQSAQPGRGESILGRVLGLGTDVFTKQQYGRNLNGILKMKEYAGQMAEARDKQALEKKHAAMREQVGSVLGDTSMSHEDRFAQLTKMLGTAYSIGDMQSMGAIANAMQTAKPEGTKPKEYEPKAFTLKDGSLSWIRPGDPIPSGAKPFHEPPAGGGEDKMLVQVEGPDGPIWVKRSSAEGMAVKKSGAAGSAQNAASEALLRASVGEMGNADSFMKEYENDLASGKKSINGLSQFVGGLGNSFTHDDPASRAIQNTALTALNKINPDLARYIRRGLSFAEGEAGISKRPSDFRTKMATFLSTAASGASPEMIHDIQGRRSSILTPLHDVVSKMETPKGSGSASVPDYEAWKKSKGHK